MNASTDARLQLQTPRRHFSRELVQRLVAEIDALRRQNAELRQRQVVNERTEHYQASTSTNRQ